MSFLAQIRDDRVRLSAAGLFYVGMHLIPSVIINHLTMFRNLICNFLLFTLPAFGCRFDVFSRFASKLNWIRFAI